MLVENKLKVLQELVNNSTREELVWINGYLNGIVRDTVFEPSVSKGSHTAPRKVTFVYGTETGNSKKLATDFAGLARKRNIPAKVIGLDQYRLSDLQKEEYLFAVVSTHGDGEPPVAARKFYDYLHQDGGSLGHIKYGVLALGDTSYPLFCKTGEDVDVRLQQLGAKRVVPLQKCDVSYEEDATQWIETVLKSLTRETAAPATATAVSVPAPAKKTGKQSYKGKVISITNLNDRGSAKQTWHIEFDVPGIAYSCGDSIGIVPENDSRLVTDIIALTNADGNKTIEYKNERYSIYELLKRKLNIIYLNERLVKQYGTITGHEVTEGRTNLFDLLKKFPVKNTVQFEEVLVALNPIAPRLYTIASSPKAHEDEVHIIVARDRYLYNGEIATGLCSGFLGTLKAGQELQFFVQPNKRFKLPPAGKDMIFVGPGTGIAGFRSFVAEREFTGDEGRNWLFFGEQRFASDFLYQTELQQWVETGVLSKVSLAFSRDQEEKIYVQHRMLQQAEELFQWLEAGAYFFISGKKDPMSADVEKTLLEIIASEGKMSDTAAREYLEKIEKEGRYEKDVY